MAEEGKNAWMRHGAISYYECSGNDLTPPEMGGVSARSFTDLAGASKNETVWFSFITFESKEHRDKVNAAVMEEMSTQAQVGDEIKMPFEMKRMTYGGFKVEVEG